MEDATTKVDSQYLNSYRESNLQKVEEFDQSANQSEQLDNEDFKIMDIQQKAKGLLANFIVSKHFKFSPNNELVVGSQIFEVMATEKA